MITYYYRARDKEGKLITGDLKSDSKEKAAQYLRGIDYTVIALTKKKVTFHEKLLDLSSPIKYSDINVFTQQLATLIRAGVPMVNSLSIIIKQLTNPRFRRVCQDIVRLLEEGLSFSEALEKHIEVFGSLYIGSVRAGEASGSLDEILERLAELGEHDADLREKIKSATRYPMIAVGILVIAVSILTTFVVPMFANLFSQFKGTLPLPTRILMGFSDFMRSYWYFVLAAATACVVMIRMHIKTRAGKRRWDAFSLKIPIFGKLLYLLLISQFARISGILIRSGIPVMKALEMVAEAVSNEVLATETRNVVASVVKGRPIAEPMRRSSFFPTMLTEMVAIGEQTGRLDQMLFYIADYMDRRSDYMIKNLSSMIEPVLIIVLGGIVLLLALAIFLPMWDMIALLRG